MVRMGQESNVSVPARTSDEKPGMDNQEEEEQRNCVVYLFVGWASQPSPAN